MFVLSQIGRRLRTGTRTTRCRCDILSNQLLHTTFMSICIRYGCLTFLNRGLYHTVKNDLRRVPEPSAGKPSQACMPVSPQPHSSEL